MEHIELPNPKPWPDRKPQAPYAYRTLGKDYLPTPSECKTEPGFFAVLQARITRREFGPIDDLALWTWLWNSVGVSSSSPIHSVERWQHRRYPSSGGVHEIDVLTVDRIGGRLFRYDPIAHATEQIACEDGAASSSLTQEAENILPLHDGRLVWMVADVDLIAAKYEHPESLIWRDAGVVAATMCFVGEAMNLACCPLGMTGEPHVSKMLGSSGRIIGVGGLAIGSRR